MINSSDTIGNRTRDLPAWRAVPQETAPRRTPQIIYGDINNNNNSINNNNNNSISIIKAWFCTPDVAGNLHLHCHI
jgi:hypothetical protein